MSGLDERRYQVFVSSTFEDLKDEREKVLQAVLEMKAFPAGMELFPSADDEQWAFIQREIESSDYYVLITAGKYGSLAPDGVSFTEKEYDYAVSLKKYVMSFIRKDLTAIPAGQSEMDGERRQKLETFHRKVQQSKLVRFFDNPDELKAQVMQALVRACQFQPREGWVRAKNARRFEDLEELTRLQKRVMELEAENLKLADTTAPFAQGDDVLEWTLPLVAVRPPKSGPKEPDKPLLEPPTDSFIFRSTWNQLLVGVFENAETEVTAYVVRQRFRKMVEDGVLRSFPGSQEWSSLSGKVSGGIQKESFEGLITAVKLQCLGLDLVEEAWVERQSNVFGQTNFRTESHWCLTRKGRTQLLAIQGILRKAVE